MADPCCSGGIEFIRQALQARGNEDDLELANRLDINTLHRHKELILYAVKTYIKQLLTA